MTEQEQVQSELAALYSNKVLPELIRKNKKGYEANSYYVVVKNKRTGYTKLMPRHKAHRYLNNRPSLWKWTNPIFGFKDEYEIVGG